jgi:glutamate synthase (ferredoxin)
MSGGIAYVLDEAGDFGRRCNRQLVDLEPLDEEAEAMAVEALIRKHADVTGSVRARKLLLQWETVRRQFVKIMPRDYRRVLQAQEKARREGREPLWEELLGTGVQRG